VKNKNPCKSPLFVAILFLLLTSCGEGRASSSALLSSSSAKSSSSFTPQFSKVTPYLNNGSSYPQEQAALPLSAYQAKAPNEVRLDTTTELDEFDGYGAALTHSSAYWLESMDSATREDALERLFGEKGHFTMCRLAIGTSDYTNTSDFYTLDDNGTEKDYDLTHFSVALDQAYLIPALKEILKINPDITFLAAPWSAPAWMKDSGSLLSGSLIAGTGSFPSLEETAYVDYLYHYVDAYAKEGISIRYLSLVNEPDLWSLTYPVMHMEANQWARLAKLLRSKLTAGGYSQTLILAYDHNIGGNEEDRFFATYLSEIAADSELLDAIGGFAVHAYGENWIEEEAAFFKKMKRDYPTKKLFLTEITEYDGSGDDALARFNWASGNITVTPEYEGCHASLYWNYILDNKGQPVLGNQSVCYGVLAYQDGQLSNSPAYYAMSQLSQFAYPIAGKKPVRLTTLLSDETTFRSVSYRRGDGVIVSVLLNLTSAPLSLSLVYNIHEKVEVSIPALSSLTLLSEPA
jgi:glucosylceramidase